MLVGGIVSNNFFCNNKQDIGGKDTMRKKQFSRDHFLCLNLAEFGLLILRVGFEQGNYEHTKKTYLV